MKESLTRKVTKEEVYLVIKSMPSNKSPGPDGFTVKFFRAYWDTGTAFNKSSSRILYIRTTT